MIKFHKCKLKPSLLDQWVETNSNVLLIGEKGVGKSHQILETFKRNNLKYAYFSGSTLDPWIHLLGIPKAKKNESGKEVMDFILPENLDDDVEAIFCDEWNRTHKTVRNALLELQQFKSINGRKFPKLRFIWGAVNPAKTEEDEKSSYDVDELDPAQMDRFHIIVELPNEPDPTYFKKKFGEYKGAILVDWWKKQPKEALEILSPRRLEYVGESYDKGLDIKYLLPITANVKMLVDKLSVDEKDELLNEFFKNPTEEGMKEFLSNEQNILEYKNILKHQKYWVYWKFMNKEFIMDEIKTNINFENFGIFQYLKGDETFKSAMDELGKSNPKATTLNIIKILEAQNYKVSPTNLKSVVSVENDEDIPFSLKCASKNDDFSTSDPTFLRLMSSKNPKYDPASVKMLTVYRKKGIDALINCFNSSAAVNSKAVINFVMSCLLSMQRGTLIKIKKWDQLIAETIKLGKNVLEKDEFALLQKQIRHNSLKIHPKNIQYVSLFGEQLDSTGSILPDEFLKKITDIRTVLNIAGSNDVPF